MSGPRHIVLYSEDPDEGGVARYNHSILCGLARAGYRVTAVQSASRSPLIREQHDLGVRHHWLDFHTRRDVTRNATNPGDAEKAFAATRPDLVLFTNCSPGSHVAAKTVAIRQQVPFVVVDGYVAALDEVSPQEAWFLDHIEEHYRQARAVIAVSQENLDLLHRQYKLPAGKGEVIHYGRPDVYFQPPRPEVRRRLRTEHGIPADAVLCLTIGRLEPVKGYQQQVDALRELRHREAWPKLYFAWVGPGSLKQKLKAALDKLGVAGHVKLLGQRWDIPDWLDASDVFLLPSHYEGMPLAIMEAMAKGLPVLASAISGIPEELGDTGKLLPSPVSDPAGTVREIVQTLQAWAADPALRASVGEAGKRRAEALFREQRMVDETIQVIERALLPAADHVSPGLAVVRPEAAFPDTGRTQRCSGASPAPSAATPSVASAITVSFLPAKGTSGRGTGATSVPRGEEVDRAMASPTQKAAPAPTAPTISPRQLMELYVREQFEELSERFLEVLRYFHNTSLPALDKTQQYYVDAFVKVFLHLFTQTDFRPPDHHVEPYVRLNLTVSNLVAMSSFRTTDPYLEVLKQQPYNLAKILTLLSARNRVKFDRRAFFDAGAATASVWYDAYAQIYRSGLVNADVVANLQEHYGYQDARLEPNHEMQELYFGSTYVDGRCDRLIKPVVNRSVQKMARQRGVVIRNKPDPKKIAVLSGNWHKNHSVYRNYAAYLDSLKGHYHLTFFRLGRHGPDPEVGIFDRVELLDVVDGVLNIDLLRQNDFMVVYYPDIGMTPHSILLANLRLAPIQVTSPGHSVSSWGADIDYFLSGADVELPVQPERNYSERLVLLPGCGVIHNRPLYEPRGRRAQGPPFVLNCPWTAMKITNRFCTTLRKLVQGAKKWLRFRVFPGGSINRQNDYVPFVRSLSELLGSEHVEVIPAIAYADYMARLEDGDLCLDSYHFGGCNTVADGLYLRKPTVTWEGDKWYSRIGSQMLRQAGLPELIATNEEQFLAITLRLINDDGYRQTVEEQLRRVDLDATVFSKADAKYFRKAIDYLIANHAQLQQDTERSAIRIER